MPQRCLWQGFATTGESDRSVTIFPREGKISTHGKSPSPGHMQVDTPSGLDVLSTSETPFRKLSHLLTLLLGHEYRRAGVKARFLSRDRVRPKRFEFHE